MVEALLDETGLVNGRERDCVRAVPTMDDLLSISLHSERLSCRGGPVNEESAVLAIHEGVAQHFAVALLKHVLLRRIFIQNFFEAVHLVVCLLTDLIVVGVKNYFLLVSVFADVV